MLHTTTTNQGTISDSRNLLSFSENRLTWTSQTMMQNAAAPPKAAVKRNMRILGRQRPRRVARVDAYVSSTLKYAITAGERQERTSSNFVFDT